MTDEICRSSFKVVVRRVEKPFSTDLTDELNWICESLGFLEPENKSVTAATVFKEIVKATEQRRPHTSTTLANTLEVSRGAIINHLNNLLRSGLIAKEGRYYYSRSRSMVRTIKEVEEDILRVFRQMEQVAKEIDKEFGIEITE